MLEDTSFAILPNKASAHESISLQELGRVLQYKRSDDTYYFECEHGYVTLRFYLNDIIRVCMNPLEIPDMQTSVAVVLRQECVRVSLEEADDRIVLKTSKVFVTILKHSFRISVYRENGEPIVTESAKGLAYSGKEVICFKDSKETDRYYGLGEKTGLLDKKGDKLTMWNTDVFAPHNPETDPLYQSIPFVLSLQHASSYGIYFDNTWKSVFDFTSNEYFSFLAEGGQLDYYILCGPNPKEVVKQFTTLTGRMPLPPKWALGYHQSRYSYMSEEEVRNVVDTFEHKNIPLDAIHLDIHYMDEYRVFTFDPHRFYNYRAFIKEMRERGVRIVPIVDPGVKRDPEYDVYQQGVRDDRFCKYLEGDIFYGDVWPGESAFPDFTDAETRKWWGKLHSVFADAGIEGIWNDMNEPSVFNETKTIDGNVMHKNDGNPCTHRALHNVYGLQMAKATYEGMKTITNKRPFVLTRAGFSGIQRYAAVWTGDNRSFWEHLELSLPMLMNLGLSGVPFVGADVGGFAHDVKGELLVRWTQIGAFYPFFRNHSSIGTVRQEPWAFGEKYENIIATYIRLRYTWLPQLYTLFAQASLHGLPIMRPLFLEYPEDACTHNLNTQFMVGNNVIIAPILRPDCNHREVYLPNGNWVNYWSEEVLAGKAHHLIKAPLEILPIFVKQGSILFLNDRQNNRLQIHIYYAKEAAFTGELYDDDGETFAYKDGQFVRREVMVHTSGDTIDISVRAEGNEASWSLEDIEFVLHGCQQHSNISLNGQILLEDQISAKNSQILTFLMV
ncbi:glycoside hydrolase family 31 protein [Ectobacillus polymachus]|uniref:glycoside hydrolase family 31 protein n=1 Tax=Ectobacillus polymachus TaxID=1508806 RepID=UPI003A86F0B7